MDVDAMTAEKQTALMRKGACFSCEEPGHLAQNCSKKKNISQKRTIKEIHSFIDALNKEEKEELASLQVSGGETGFLKWRAASISVSPSVLTILNCLLAQVMNNSMNLPLKFLSQKQDGIVIVKEGFLDSGAGENFIDQNYIKNPSLNPLESTMWMEFQTSKEPLGNMLT